MEKNTGRHTFFPIPAFTDNYIWAIINQENNYITVIDPGDSVPVIQFITKNNFTLEAILITHHHADHVAGVTHLIETYNPQIYAPSDLNFSDLTQSVNDGTSFNLPKTNMDFNVFAVPGHTLDHIAYYSTGYLFCGDTLFSAGCGRVFEGTPEQMLTSLNKIKNLPLDTLIFCAHEYTLGNLLFAEALEPKNASILKHIEHVKKLRSEQKASLPSRLKLEQEINPFLRVDKAPVKISAERYAGHELKSDVDVFAAIREWKNRF